MEQTLNQPIPIEQDIKAVDEVRQQDTNYATVVLDIPSEQLLAALFFAWDGAERAQLDIFLIKDTAKQVRAYQDLKGHNITLGVRKNEWNSGQGRIFQTFAEHEIGGISTKTDDEVVYDCKGVAIVIKLYNENETLKSFNPIFYRMETFNLPNPFDLFVSKYE